jgi:molybdopterin converting factor small subunit
VHVNVRLGSGLATLAGRARLRVDVPDGATVKDLVAAIERTHAPLSAGLNGALAVIEGNQVTRDEPLGEGAEVALLMPAAGG